MQSWGRVVIAGNVYDIPGPTSMSQGQSWSWSASHLFGHDANGYRGAVGVSVSFRVDGTGYHDNSAGAGTQGALDYDRRPSAPSFSNITRTTNSIYVALSGGASPAGTPTYYIQRNTNGGGWGDQRTGSSATFSNLPQGSTHQFRAFATNSDGQSGSADSGVYSVPSVPVAPSISATTPSGRSLAVTAGVSANGGATVTGYFVQSSLDEGATWSAAQSLTTERTFNFTNLRGGSTYLFRVYSTNEMGSSALTTSAPIFVTSGGRRASASGFVSATIAKRWTATGFVDIVTAKRWTGTIWTDLS
jgi:hypothetical protein